MSHCQIKWLGFPGQIVQQKENVLVELSTISIVCTPTSRTLSY